MAGRSGGRLGVAPSQLKFEREQKARRAKERAVFVAKQKAITERRREQLRRNAIAAAENLRKRKLKVSQQSPQLRKAAGITPQVERLAAEGNKAAQEFLRAAEARVAGAVKVIKQGPPLFTTSRVRGLIIFHTDKRSKETFRRGLAFAAGGSKGLKQFNVAFARDTSRLESAKGAASGESRKAGLLTDSSGFLAPVGTTFKRNILDSISVSESGGVTKFSPQAKPENILRGGPANLILGGAAVSKSIQDFDLSTFIKAPESKSLQSFLSPIQEKTIITQAKQNGQDSPRIKDILEQGQDVLQSVSDSPLKGLLGVSGLINLGVTKTALSTFAFLTNVEKQLGGLITGKEVGQLTEVSKEPTSELLGGIIGGAFEGKGVEGSLKAGGSAFVKEAKRFGLLETVGNVGAFLLPGSQGIKALSPLRLISFEGSKLLVATAPGKAAVLLSKSPGKAVVKGFDITSIGKEKFVALSKKFSVKAKGGAEIDFLGKIQSKILVSEKSLKSLTSAGFITKGGADLIRAGKTVVKESKGLPKPLFQETFPKGSFGLNPKQLEAQLKFFKESKITLEGSSIDALANIPKFAIRPGDADIKVKAILEGQKLAAQNVKALKPFSTGQKLELLGKDKTQVFLDGKKVTEFLVAGADETGQLAKKGFVLGVKTDTKTIKTLQGVKIRTGRFQTARMIASITSIQPPKVLGGPTRIGPPINPLGSGTTRAKDFPKAFARTKTEASIAATNLLGGKAKKLEGAAAIIKREGSKEISFPKFFKARAVTPEVKKVLEKAPTITGFKEPSLVSKISDSPVSNLISNKILLSSPLIKTSSQIRATGEPVSFTELDQKQIRGLLDPEISRITSVRREESQIASLAAEGIKVKDLDPVALSLLKKGDLDTGAIKFEADAAEAASLNIKAVRERGISKSISKPLKLSSPIRSLVSKTPRSPLGSKAPTTKTAPIIKTSLSKALVSKTSFVFSPKPSSPSSPSLSKLTGGPGSPTPGKPGFPSVPSKGGPITKITDSSSSGSLVPINRIKAVRLINIGAIVKRTKPVPRKRRVDFLGNTLLSDIRSFRTKKEDIRFGRIGISRIVSTELRAAKSKSLIDDVRGTKKLSGRARFSKARFIAKKIKRERASKIEQIGRI